jgi:hypothetical protein
MGLTLTNHSFKALFATQPLQILSVELHIYQSDSPSLITTAKMGMMLNPFSVERQGKPE